MSAKQKILKRDCLNIYLIVKLMFVLRIILRRKIVFIGMPKSYIRDAAERQMYKQYEPSCNEKEPDGRDDVKVNLT